MTTTINHCVQRCLSAGIDYLAQTQHANGSWTDFWLPVGTSDAWVTAYVGLALYTASGNRQLTAQTRQLAQGAARRAGVWLLSQQRPRQGWGYNRLAPPDADSTAHALSLLARIQLPVPADALDFLRKHAVPATGYRTYVCADPADQWTRPACDISAAVLRALYDVGALDQAELATQWQAMLGAHQDEQGWWPGYWWTTPTYTTALALEVWHLAGCPPLTKPVKLPLPTQTIFDCAWDLHTQRLLDAPGDRWSQIEPLILHQERDGGWPTGLILQVPPARADSGQRTVLAWDARRLFTTATVVSTLSCAWAEPADCDVTAVAESRQTRSGVTALPARRAAVGETLDGLIEQAAHAVGFTPAVAQQVTKTFAQLTAASLGEPSPWPTAQLSSLSGGTPLEFSATVGQHVKPTLRYAVEVGNPFLAPYQRARSSVKAIADTASQLGYDAAWSRIAPAIDQLVVPELATADAERFWVWGGVDQAVPRIDQPLSLPGLKIYVNLLHQSGKTRQRLEKALDAADFNLSPALKRVLDTLDSVGFLHEMGFGLGPKGKCASKVYYELRGWRRTLVSQLLAECNLPPAVDALCPEIPGILLEPLAAKSRAGIALRIDPTSGRISEVTTAMAFPTPLLTPQQTCQHIYNWILANGWDVTPYQVLIDTLLPTWAAHSTPLGRVHTLFTRTISPLASWSAIYLRPYLSPSSHARSGRNA